MKLPKIFGNERAELGLLLVVPVLIIISLVVVAVLGSALMPTAITSHANTTSFGSNCMQIVNATSGAQNNNGSCYGIWSSGATGTFSTTPTFITLDYLFVYILILLVAVGMIMKVVG